MRRTTDVREAAGALAAGRLVAVPTETVYGLAARADDEAAVARIFRAKARPATHPLIVHIASSAACDAWVATLPAYARRLTATYWPGPLTVVLPRSRRAGDGLTGGQASIAVRWSAHPLLQAVLDTLVDITDDRSVAVAAPSANRFGRVSPTTAEHVLAEFADPADGNLVLDGGSCAIGVESTIVDCTGEHPRLLRPGLITAEDIATITGLRCSTGSQVRAPGTLAHHYAPAARVVLVDPADLISGSGVAGAGVAGAGVDGAGVDEGLTSDGRASGVGLIAPVAVPTPPGVIRLAAPVDAADYARLLYRALREADDRDLGMVLAVPPAASGIGSAVLDRLLRAAAPGGDVP